MARLMICSLLLTLFGCRPEPFCKFVADTWRSKELGLLKIYKCSKKAENEVNSRYEILLQKCPEWDWEEATK